MKTLSEKDFERFDFDGFLEHGFILHNPGDEIVYLGKLEEGKSNGSELFFTCNFYQNSLQNYSVQDLYQINLNTLSLWVVSFFQHKTSIQKIEDHDQLYREDVMSCLGWIENDHELTKLVSVSYAQYNINNIHPLSRLPDLLQNLNGFLYGHWQGANGVIGVSPEPLFYQIKNRFYTYALAGTISTAEKNYKERLLSDNKERLEHQFVIDDIVNKLSDIAEDIKIGTTEVYNFGPLAHLKTPIEFNYSNVDKTKLIKTLTPTAALGGFPSKLCMDYLKQTHYYEFERENRNFGGVYGLFTQEMSCALVGIRNLYWRGSVAYIHSGSGIVADSNIDKECLEIQRKRLSIEDIFIHG